MKTPKTIIIICISFFLVMCNKEEDVDTHFTFSVDGGQEFEMTRSTVSYGSELSSLYISGNDFGGSNKTVTISLFGFPENATGSFNGYDYTTSTWSLYYSKSAGDTYHSTDWGSNAGALPSPVIVITEHNDRYVKGTFSGSLINAARNKDDVVNIEGSFLAEYINRD